MEGQINRQLAINFSIIIKNQILFILLIIASIIIPVYIFSTLNHIFILSISNWDIFLDPIGFIIPLATCVIFIITSKIGLKYLILGIIPVSLMAFIISTPILEKGIVAPFPLWLFPAILAGMIAVFNYEKMGERICYQYAFILGVFSIFIGADIAHLPTLFQLSTTSPMQAIIGGAGILDLILLSGILSVLFTKIALVCLKKIQCIEIFRSFNMHM